MIIFPQTYLLLFLITPRGMGLDAGWMVVNGDTYPFGRTDGNVSWRGPWTLPFAAGLNKANLKTAKPKEERSLGPRVTLWRAFQKYQLREPRFLLG